MKNLDQLLKIAREASSEASKAILEVYNSEEFDLELKGDNSPLTKADKVSHQIIETHLKDTGIPILSEEGVDIPYELRKDWDMLWIVDPLDGTKEFIKRNGEFTVNIALVENGVPILGVVEAPVLELQYFGLNVKGSWVKRDGKIHKLAPINKLNFSQEGLKVVASRSHLSQETQEFLTTLTKPEITSMGSSLKFMLIAEGKADIYPRFAPTMEWDTAASQAIINSLGGNVVNLENRSLLYNKKNLLNPFFKVY